MFERFTDRASRTVVHAQEEAKLLNHNYIGTEHILLGLIHEGEGAAAQVLLELGVSIDDAREAVVSVVGKVDIPPAQAHLPFTPRAKWVLEQALREALAMGDSYIGVEHILLALTRLSERLDGYSDRSVKVVEILKVNVATVRHNILTLLNKKEVKPPLPVEEQYLKVDVEHRSLDGRATVGTRHANVQLGLTRPNDTIAEVTVRVKVRNAAGRLRTIEQVFDAPEVPKPALIPTSTWSPPRKPSEPDELQYPIPGNED